MAEQHCPECGTPMVLGATKCACGYVGGTTLLPKHCACGKPVAVRWDHSRRTEYLCFDCYDARVEGTELENELYRMVRERSLLVAKELEKIPHADRIHNFKKIMNDILTRLEK